MGNEGLTYKTKKGIIWSSIERFGTQGIQFVFSIILARLLSPSDYGIIAMPMIFLALAQVIIDSGFANALIRKPDLNEDDLSTAFYFNIIVGCVCYFILYAFSPLIADFYETPILSSVLKITALSTLFNPLCIVQQTILTIKIDFKSQARISVISYVLGGLLGIYMAYQGYGVWALVVSQTLSSLLRVVLLWSITGWRPKSRWSKESFKYLWGLGSKLMLSGILECIYQNIYTMIIGKFYTKDNLGYYTRAHNFAQLPSTNIYGVIRRVTLPILSSIQNDEERLVGAFCRILRVSVFVIFPMMIGLVGIAEPLVRVILSDKWLPSVPLLQILSIAMMWIPIDALNLSLLMVKGRSDLFLHLEIIKKVVGALILILTIKQGLNVICYGYCAYCIFEIISDTYYTGKFYGIGLLRQIVIMMPTGLLSLTMLLIILVLNKLVNDPYIQLSVGVLSASSFYYLVGRFSGMKEYGELIAFIKAKR